MNEQQKNKAPAFQFYVQDFLMGTLMFSNEEVGVYLKLLLHQWDKGGLDDDKAVLCALAGITLRNKVLARVLTKFEKCADGKLRNMRLEKERKNKEDFKNKAIALGKRGAERRWQDGSNKHNEGLLENIGESIAENMAKNMAGNMAENMAGNIAENMAGNIAENMAGNMAKNMALLSSSSFSSSEYLNKGSGFEKKEEGGMVADEQGWCHKPVAADVGGLPPEMVQGIILRLKATRDVVVTEVQLESCWLSFKQLKLTGETTYDSAQRVYDHFGNWMRNENFTKVVKQLSGYGGKTREPPADPRWKEMIRVMNDEL